MPGCRMEVTVVQDLGEYLTIMHALGPDPDLLVPTRSSFQSAQQSRRQIGSEFTMTHFLEGPYGF